MKQELIKILREQKNDSFNPKTFRKGIKKLLSKNFEKIKNENLYGTLDKIEPLREKRVERLSLKQAEKLLSKVHLFLDGSLNKKSTLKKWRNDYPKIKKNQAVTMVDCVDIDISCYDVNYENTLSNWKKQGYIYE